MVRSAFAWKLSIVWVMYAAVLPGATYGPQRIGLHYKGSTKDAVVWGLIAGLPLLFKFDAARKTPGLLRDTLVGGVRLT